MERSRKIRLIVWTILVVIVALLIVKVARSKSTTNEDSAHAIITKQHRSKPEEFEPLAPKYDLLGDIKSFLTQQSEYITTH